MENRFRCADFRNSFPEMVAPKRTLHLWKFGVAAAAVDDEIGVAVDGVVVVVDVDGVVVVVDVDGVVVFAVEA